ncbi:MAG: hydantoinase B/oxoprolinase family protein [Gemmatimonadetes bacterium]|nr:hydantoinase B/oxoprolinase family protein [Gemmatimonadota bacterium]
MPIATELHQEGVVIPPLLLVRRGVRNEELLAHQEALEEELQRLKTALDREKEVVDRLRRGKLDLERRTADAEATIEALHKPGFLQRLLKRGGD